MANGHTAQQRDCLSQMDKGRDMAENRTECYTAPAAGPHLYMQGAEAGKTCPMTQTVQTERPHSVPWK